MGIRLHERRHLLRKTIKQQFPERNERETSGEAFTCLIYSVIGEQRGRSALQDQVSDVLLADPPSAITVTSISDSKASRRLQQGSGVLSE